MVECEILGWLVGWIFVRWLVCVIDWFAFLLLLVLWIYFVDCHCLCIVRLFSRVWLCSFVSPWFRKSCGAYAALRVGLLRICLTGSMWEFVA